MNNDLKELKDKEVFNSSFFDFGERGKLGLFLLTKVEKDYQIAGYINNFDIENYFLKSIGFLEKSQVQVLNGATFLIKKTELSGDTKQMSRTQQVNCNFNELCLPFVHFGLGKINNYVEDFKVVVP